MAPDAEPTGFGVNAVWRAFAVRKEVYIFLFYKKRMVIKMGEFSIIMFGSTAHLQAKTVAKIPNGIDAKFDGITNCPFDTG